MNERDHRENGGKLHGIRYSLFVNRKWTVIYCIIFSLLASLVIVMALLKMSLRMFFTFISKTKMIRIRQIPI